MTPRQTRRTRGRVASPRAGTVVLTEGTQVRSRSMWLMSFFAIAATLMLWRLAEVQIVQGPGLHAQAVAEHVANINLPAQRGLILDSEGQVLVANQTVYDVFADPAMIPASARPLYAHDLAPVLGMQVTTLEQLMSGQGQFVYLAKQVSAATRVALDNLNLIGIGLIPDNKRVYQPSPVPGQSFAANLLGFVDANGNGKYGIEQYYNNLLTGTPGHQSVLHDLAGNAIQLSSEKYVAPKNGDNLQLALNSQIQYWAEQILANDVKASQSSSGEVIVLDTRTGGIAAMADYPSFNANQYWLAPYANLQNSAISFLYEPGSVMKTVTFAGGLNTGVITPSTRYYDQPITIDGSTIQDWDRIAQGWVTMQWVLDDSLNDGAINVQQRMGQNAFYENLLAFGIGSPTGVDLPGEENMPLPPQTQWQAINYATASFGQGIMVTPLQMAAAVNAIANDGVWIQPHAVDTITNPNTGKVTHFVPRTRRVMSVSAAKTEAVMMTHVVDDPGAEGVMAQIPGFKGEIAGKTGTASVAVNGVYGNNVIVSFAGFFPASNPQYTILVVLNYPQETYVTREGAFLAAPAWKQLAELIINQYQIQP